MADLSVPKEYYDILYRGHILNKKDTPRPSCNSRKYKNKIIPNYDVPHGCKNYAASHYPISYNDMTYSEYKTWMINIINQLKEFGMGEYHHIKIGGLIVNRGSHPKTNTTEYAYRHLRRMIKDGILRMIKVKVPKYRTVSVLIVI